MRHPLVVPPTPFLNVSKGSRSHSTNAAPPCSAGKSSSQRFSRRRGSLSLSGPLRGELCHVWTDHPCIFTYAEPRPLRCSPGKNGFNRGDISPNPGNVCQVV